MSLNPKKRIVRAFKMGEISAVDFPAQEGAGALIIKRRDNETLVGFAKALRRDPDRLKKMVDQVQAVLKGLDTDDGFITAAHVYRFMVAYALARKQPNETLALAWGRLMISDKAMIAFYAAHQQLIIMGRKGDPVEEVSESQAREVDEPAADPDARVSNREDAEEKALEKFYRPVRSY